MGFRRMNYTQIKYAFTLLFIGFLFQTQVANASDECIGFEPPGAVMPILSETGSFEKILVYEEYFADSSDAEDVSAGIRAAQLKAKAALSKFLGEETETEDTLMEMSKSLKEKGTEGKLVTSERLKVQIQNVKSKSKQVLRGLIKLADCYEPDTNRVMVELGTNLKLLDAANQIRNAFSNEQSSNVDSNAVETSTSGSNQSGFTRSSKAKSDF
jgi:hypothetical protein